MEREVGECDGWGGRWEEVMVEGCVMGERNSRCKMDGVMKVEEREEREGVL
jgi:hypothetical protein